MNNKLNEFIIKHNDFYSKLSSDNKHLISNLDFYGDLQAFNILNLLSYSNSEENYTYLYIGKKDEVYYFFKCNYNFISNNIQFNIKTGQIIIFKNIFTFNDNEELKVLYK